MRFDPKLNTLSVRLYGRQAGVITRLAGDKHVFAFEQDYIDDIQRPTLSLSFKGRTGGLATDLSIVRRRVPAFFSNLLPEGHLRDYLAMRANVDAEREFFLLAALGADLPGAIVVEPLDTGNRQAGTHHEGDDLNDDVHPGNDPLRFSLAGVQLKFSAVMDAASGLTIPAAGMGGAWIVKLPSPRFAAVPENEFVMLELARRTGISVPENRLVDVSSIKGLPEQTNTVGVKALAVQRFDRLSNGSPVHMEDFAQVFGVFPNDKYKSHSYANIAAVLWAEIGEVAVYEFVRRLVFSIVIGNGDMHLKNWSLLYPDRRTPQLSPGYDFVSTIPYIANDKLALRFGDSNRLSEITKDQMRRFANTARIPVSPLWRIAVETAERVAESWKTLACTDILPKDQKDSIGKHILGVSAGIR